MKAFHQVYTGSFRLIILIIPIRSRPDIRHPYVFRIREPECQLISVNHQLHRIPHGCELHEGNLLARNQPHIQEMLPQRAVASHRNDSRSLSYF